MKPPQKPSLPRRTPESASVSRTSREATITSVARARLFGAWVAGAYLGWMYVQMGWVKFDPDGFWTPAFERWGYPVWLRLLVGFIETAGGVSLIVPWFASYGAAGLAVVMLGAWMTRLNDGRMVDVAWITVYLAALVWIAFEWWGWRRPRVRFRLRRSERAD